MTPEAGIVAAAGKPDRIQISKVRVFHYDYEDTYENIRIKDLPPDATHIELRHVQQVQRGGGHEVDLFQ